MSIKRKWKQLIRNSERGIRDFQRKLDVRPWVLKQLDVFEVWAKKITKVLWVSWERTNRNLTGKYQTEIVLFCADASMRDTLVSRIEEVFKTKKIDNKKFPFLNIETQKREDLLEVLFEEKGIKYNFILRLLPNNYLNREKEGINRTEWEGHLQRCKEMWLFTKANQALTTTGLYEQLESDAIHFEKEIIRIISFSETNLNEKFLRKCKQNPIFAKQTQKWMRLDWSDEITQSIFPENMPWRKEEELFRNNRSLILADTVQVEYSHKGKLYTLSKLKNTIFWGKLAETEIGFTTILKQLLQILDLNV